jgi:hypothetical protein
MTQRLHVIGVVQGQCNVHSLTGPNRLPRRRVGTNGQERHLTYIAFEIKVFFEVAPHLLKLCPGHKRSQIEVPANSFDDGLFR